MTQRGNGSGAAWVKALRYSTVGIEFGVGTVIGFWVGSWLDAKYDTSPTFTIVLVLVGITAAFASLIRLTREAIADSEDADDIEDRPSGDG